MDEPRPLLHVSDETEGEDVCERLRAVGIKCAVAPLPDVNSLAGMWGGRTKNVLTVLVHESDLEKARAVLAP